MASKQELQVFVATRLEDVPNCKRYLSVDGTVPGYFRCWDHHVTGEKINLDAMPQHIDLSEIDGVGTTLADTDAVTSVVAVLLGGKQQLSSSYLSVFESASHWCDHLGPHPGHDERINEQGLQLDAAVNEVLLAARKEGPSAVSKAFSRVCYELFDVVVSERSLPQSQRWKSENEAVERLFDAKRVEDSGTVALVDLRDFEEVTPRALYNRLKSPLAILLEQHSLDRGRRYTVGVNPRSARAPANLRLLLETLAREEFSVGAPCKGPEPIAGNENWGGRATVFGSPWNYGSRLSPERVREVANEFMKQIESN